LEDGTPYLVMEYLEGADLAEELARRGRIDPIVAAHWLRQACEALSVAHAAGVIHRDLKPANLFLTTSYDGSRLIKVVDFGVSKALADSAGEAALTKTSSLVGSPLYMSPEQLNSSRNVDGRSDLWALGTILYELITGRPPFVGDAIPQLVNAILNSEPPSFESLRIAAPVGLESVIQRALSKPRDQRYSTAEELSLALAPFAPNPAESGSGVKRLWNRSESPSHEGRTMTSKPPDAQRRPRRRLWTALSIVALAVVLGVIRYVTREPALDTRMQPSTAADTQAAFPAQDDSPQTPPPAPELPPSAAPTIPREHPAAPLPPKAAAAPEPPRALPKPSQPSQPKTPSQPAAKTPPANPLEIPGFGGRR
jgi:serine/threonine-protein kinase